jgi:hypothetical protein
MNWNGFYKLDSLDKEQLVALYQDALLVAKEARVDVKFKRSFSREASGMEPASFIQNYLTVESHNTVINRYVKNNCEEYAAVEGEVGSYYRKPDWELTTIDAYYLYLVLDLTEFNKLVIKHQLKRKEL